MKNLMITAAIAASMLVPAAAQAQALPPAVVAVVDLDRVSNDCNACKTAAASLRGQVNALQAREKALAAPLQAEKTAIQSAIDALKGSEPPAALQARIKAFQDKQQSGGAEITRQQDQIQNNQRYVQKQIQDKLNPIYSSVMQKRGASLLVDVAATLATAASLDVTADVVAALNASLPSLSTNAPAAAAAASTKPSTQGR
ncbi:MAG: OmpH family outer membrane protein [Sphingomicrobium sp.]